MAQTRSIEIDFEVHQKIEAERRGFEEPPIKALRRLLELPEPPTPKGLNGDAQPNKRGWYNRGVRLPHGTELRMELNGQQYRGYIDDGSWVVEGQKVKPSPSGAARVARTRVGTPAIIDGWHYWYVKRPGDTDWILINRLRS